VSEEIEGGSVKGLVYTRVYPKVSGLSR